MNFKTVCKNIFTVFLLFFIILCCIVLFHQCSLEPEKPEQEQPVEEILPVETVPEPEIAEPEPVVDTEPEPESEQQLEPVEETEVEVEPEIQPEEEPEVYSIPETPELDYPFVMEFYDGNYEDYIEEEINWDEFVFSDAELELEDGSYFGVLYVNDDNTGSISVDQVQGVTYFSKGELQSLLASLLTDEYYATFFAEEGEYYTLEYITSMAEACRFDTVNLYLYLDFNNSQMPIKNISISGKSDTTSVDYSMSGSIELEPAIFSAQSNVGISLSGYQNTDTNKFEISTGFSFGNQISFLDMVFSVPFSAYVSNTTGFSYSVGNIYGYMDYPDLSLRVTFGDVGYSGFSSGTPFGFTIEKSYSYGTDSALGNQYAQVLDLQEDSQIEIFINDKSVITRTLSMGKYRIKDFILDQGGNDIVIKVHPLIMGDDTSRDQTLEYNTDYDSSLLGRGDSLWRFGFSIPRIKSTVGSMDSSTERKAFVIPAIPRYNAKTKTFDMMQNVFIFSDFSMFWEQSIGFFDNYTQSNTLSVVAQKQGYGIYSITANVNLSVTLATKFGTSRFKLGGGFTVGKTTTGDGGISNVDFSASYSQSFVNELLKPLSLSLLFTANSSKTSVSLSTGYSFKILSLGVGASANFKYDFNTSTTPLITNTEKPFSVTGALSLDMPLGNKSSISVSTSMDSNFTFSAVVGFSSSIGGVGVSSSSSIRKGNVSSSVSMSYSHNNNSYNLGVSNIRFEDLLNHTMAASWSHKGNLANYSLRVQASNKYQTLTYSGYLSTAFAFADGYFALTKGSGGAFLMVAPQGALKKADISVSAAMSSSVTALSKTFGAGYYSGFKLYSSNSVIVYAGSDSFMFTAKPVAAQGFVAKIYKEESMSATAVLINSDGSLVTSASSPVYKVELGEDGVSVVARSVMEDSYMFTDDDGRFIIDSLQPGVYMFDINFDDAWYAMFLTIPTIVENKDELATQLIMYKDYEFGAEAWAEAGSNAAGVDYVQYDISTYDSAYAGSITLVPDQVILLDDFWDMLYGSEEEDFDTFEASESSEQTVVVQTFEAAP